MRTILVALLLLPLAGCTTAAVDPTERFPDADQRWSQRLDAPAEVRYQATVLEGPAVWRLSAVSDAGFDVEVFRRGQLIDGDLDYEDWTFRVDELHWRPFTPNAAGEATVVVDCTGACAYTLARDEGADIPEVKGLGERHQGARARFAGSLSEDFGSHDFEVPPGVTALGFRADAHAPDDWLRFTVTMADGERFDFLRFPAVAMKNLQVTATAETFGLDAFPAGTWNLLVDCEGECAYAHGFYW